MMVAIIKIIFEILLNEQIHSKIININVYFFYACFVIQFELSTLKIKFVFLV